MRPEGPIADFEIDLEPIWPAEDARLEPLFLAEPLWIDFDETGADGPALPDWPTREPLPVEFDPAAPLVALQDDTLQDDNGARVFSTTTPCIDRLASWLGSVGVHLLPLLLLIALAPRGGGSPSSIVPVRLIMMRAPISEPTLSTPQLQAAALPPPQLALPPLPIPDIPPPPRPQRRAPLAPPQPNKPPPRQESQAEQRAANSATPTPSHAAAADAATQPAAMTRDQYLGYLVNLTWQHVDMLPASFIAGRKGQTKLLIRVLSDGTIASITVAQSSGYPDIDARIEQMIRAIGRYPPLPPTFGVPSADLDMVLRFPQVLQDRR